MDMTFEAVTEGQKLGRKSREETLKCVGKAELLWSRNPRYMRGDQKPQCISETI